jgi:hypothetical protein
LRSKLIPPAFGDGDEEQSLAAMGRTDIGSSVARPCRAIPEYGQIAEDMSESPTSKPWDVLQHDDSGSNRA